MLLILESSGFWFRQRMKLFSLTLLVATLFHITSCSNDGYEYKGTRYRVLGGGTISDTTAMIIRVVTDEYSDPMGIGEDRLREFSLNLVDMRFEKIYWKKDIVPNDYSHLEFDIIDSTLFFYETNCISYHYDKKDDCKISKVAVVHIDEKFNQSEKIELKYKDMTLKGDGWESWNNQKIRPWKDGLMLAYRAGATSPYALLDTTAGTMELWRPSGEFEWLNECVDYKWSQIGGLCLKDIPDTSGFVLLRKGIDTLAVRFYTISNRRSSAFSGNSIISTDRAYLINKQGQVLENHLNVLVAFVYGSLGNFYRFMGVFYDLNGNLLVDYEYDRFRR